MTTMASVVSDISQTKKTGMLSVMAKLSKQLLKIYFVDGEIHSMHFTDRKDQECLNCLSIIEFSECFFLDGVKPSTDGKISLTTSEIIDRLQIFNKSVTLKVTSERSAADLQELSALQDKLKDALIRQIGPVGNIVFPKATDKWSASSSPTRQGLGELIDLLKEEIDEPKNRAEFDKEANKIIS